VLVHDRTEGLPAGLAEYAEGRLSRLSRHFDRITEVEVEFEKESGRGSSPFCSARVTVHTGGRRHPLISANETAGDPRGALDLALDKIDRQLVGFKDRITHRRQAVSPVRVPPVPAAPPRTEEPERLRMKLRPLSLAEASAELMADSQPFLVYVDEDSGEIQILVKRADGSLAVIEPVVP
jgi:putative sigma-54 modulation protein